MCGTDTHQSAATCTGIDLQSMCSFVAADKHRLQGPDPVYPHCLLHSAVLLNEIQSCHSSLRHAPFRSPVLAGLGLRNAQWRVLEKLDWISLGNTVDYSTALYTVCILQHSTVHCLHTTVQHCTVQYSTGYSTAQYSVDYSTVQHSTAQYSVDYSTVQHTKVQDTVQDSTGHTKVQDRTQYSRLEHSTDY